MPTQCAGWSRSSPQATSSNAGTRAVKGGAGVSRFVRTLQVLTVGLTALKDRSGPFRTPSFASPRHRGNARSVDAALRLSVGRRHHQGAPGAGLGQRNQLLIQRHQPRPAAGQLHHGAAFHLSLKRQRCPVAVVAACAATAADRRHGAGNTGEQISSAYSSSSSSPRLCSLGRPRCAACAQRSEPSWPRRRPRHNSPSRFSCSSLR